MSILSDALIIATEIGIAVVHHHQNDHKNAIHHYGQAAVVYRQIGDASEAFVLNQAAELRRLVEDRAAWRFGGTSF